MQSDEIRSRFLKFFEKRGHKIIPSASLVPLNDPSTLFTGSGMQPMVPYLLGQPHPLGTRITDSQKCFRAVDIDEVGDNRHTTFFEMLGNWSLGDYFKQEQIEWMFEFLVDDLGLDATRLYITCFIGAPHYGIPKDTEAAELWQKLFEKKNIQAIITDINTEENGYARGIKPREKIFYYEGKKNWWNRGKTGPDTTPVGDPCGPDSEMFYEFTDIEHDKKFGEHCHPNCDCGRFMEIGNNVFMSYRKEAEGKFVPLEHPNIDHGSGLERIAAAVANSSDIFPITHGSIIECLEKISGKEYASNKRSFRIIADHMKAAVFLIADGINPSNTDKGYFVRRLLRKAILHSNKLGIQNGLAELTDSVLELYKNTYPDTYEKKEVIKKEIEKEESKFRETLSKGLKILELREKSSKYVKELKDETKLINEIDGQKLFDLATTYGFPLELSLEEIKSRNISMHENAEDVYNILMAEHQKLSQTASAGMFKGGLANHNEKTIRLHTAHHLLLAALQAIVDKNIKQRGSNITEERLRIDFLCDHKLTDEEKQKVEDWVNDKIKQELNVVLRELPLAEAEKIGAEMEFGAKYPEVVSVYFIEDKNGNAISKEFCGGPHVSNTKELGTFKILKEEAVAQGIRRIKATLL